MSDEREAKIREIAKRHRLVKQVEHVSFPLMEVPNSILTALREACDWQREQDAVELEALRDYKKRVDIAFTAGILAMSGEVGFKIQAHEFITSIRVAFRQAQDEYMKTFGAEAIRRGGQ